LHDLTIIDPALPGALTTAEIDATMAYAAAEKSAATRAAYESDWRDFAAWCAARGASPLPAPQGLVAAYLSWLAQSGRRASTIGRRAAAIAHRHKLAGHEPPTSSEGVRATLRGIRRSIGTAREQKAPATADVVGAMLKHCRTDKLLGARDAALLALGFAGAFRRSELVALRVEDLTEVPNGLRVTIRQSKTDQEGQGHEVAILRGVKLCPVEAVHRWLQMAGITEGYVFRAVWRSMAVDAPLSPQVVALRVKRIARLAGLDPSEFSGHSLRAGFCTSAAEHGASLFKIMDVSRHKSVDTLRGYVRRADSFKDHAGAAFL
jgi:site-specific recombinase XerD